MVAIRYVNLGAGQTQKDVGQARLRMDDFPTREEWESEFMRREFPETVRYLQQQQLEKRQLAEENERVLFAIYQRLPELQLRVEQEVTPPHGLRIAERVYKIPVPVEEREW